MPAVAVSGTSATGLEVDFSGSDEVSNWYRFDVSGNANQKVVMHTFKYNGVEMRNYTLLYDRTKKAALWVAYPMHATAYPWNVSREDSWQYDPALDQSWQPKLTSSYSGGYDRGHQAASNDRRTTIYQMYQTDYFSNMTPQTHEFNSGKTSDWDDLETSIQNLGEATTGSDTLYVVTGAIFGNGYKSDATDNDGKACPVPTHYYKCIMKVHFSAPGTAQSATGAAFLLDHTTGTRQNKTIVELQNLTGFDFFTNIPASIQSTAEGTHTSMF